MRQGTRRGGWLFYILLPGQLILLRFTTVNLVFPLLVFLSLAIRMSLVMRVWLTLTMVITLGIRNCWLSWTGLWLLTLVAIALGLRCLLSNWLPLDRTRACLLTFVTIVLVVAITSAIAFSAYWLGCRLDRTRARLLTLATIFFLIADNNFSTSCTLCKNAVDRVWPSRNLYIRCCPFFAFRPSRPETRNLSIKN